MGALRLATIMGLVLACGDAASAASQGTYRKASETRGQYVRRRADVHRIHLQIERDFKDSQEWQDAQVELKAARAALDQVRKPILDAVRSMPQYRELWHAEQDAVRKLEELCGGGKTSSHQLLAAARKLLDIRRAMTCAEADALAREPALEDARMRLLSAHYKMRGLKAQFAQVAKSDHDWQAAQQRLAQSREKMVLAASRLEQEIESDWDTQHARLSSMIVAR